MLSCSSRPRRTRSATEWPSRVRLTCKSSSARMRAPCSCSRATVRSFEILAKCSMPTAWARGGGPRRAELSCGNARRDSRATISNGTMASSRASSTMNGQQQGEQHDDREHPLVQHLHAQQGGGARLRATCQPGAPATSWVKARAAGYRGPAAGWASARTRSTVPSTNGPSSRRNVRSHFSGGWPLTATARVSRARCSSIATVCSWLVSRFSHHCSVSAAHRKSRSSSRGPGRASAC